MLGLWLSVESNPILLPYTPCLSCTRMTSELFQLPVSSADKPRVGLSGDREDLHIYLSVILHVAYCPAYSLSWLRRTVKRTKQDSAKIIYANSFYYCYYNQYGTKITNANSFSYCYYHIHITMFLIRGWCYWDSLFTDLGKTRTCISIRLSQTIQNIQYVHNSLVESKNLMFHRSIQSTLATDNYYTRTTITLANNIPKRMPSVSLYLLYNSKSCTKILMYLSSTRFSLKMKRIALQNMLVSQLKGSQELGLCLPHPAPETLEVNWEQCYQHGAEKSSLSCQVCTQRYHQIDHDFPMGPVGCHG